MIIEVATTHQRISTTYERQWHALASIAVVVYL